MKCRCVPWVSTMVAYAQVLKDSMRILASPLQLPTLVPPMQAEMVLLRHLPSHMQEFYGDFMVHSPYHFTVPVTSNEQLFNPKSMVSSGYELVDRLVQGMSAMFLAVRRRPVIRYQKGSEYTFRLAENLHALTYKQV